MSAPADPFATATDVALFRPDAGSTPKRFGTVPENNGRSTGRYHMPLLPGEDGPKRVPGGVQPWVPGGMMRTTRLVNALADQEALMVWEQEQALIGLARDPSLFEEVVMLVQRGDREGVDWRRLDRHPEYRRALTGTWQERGQSISGRAKQAAGANLARQAGVNRHSAWEERAKSGDLIGTPEIRNQLLALELLLMEHGFDRVPALSERVVRNCAVDCAGRFDDIVRDAPCPQCGRTLRMADLKNKSRRFWSLLEPRAQLAVYARSEWMLETSPDGFEAQYIHGPAHHVCPHWGWILVMPADGADPYLYRADLTIGWEHAQLARKVVDARSEGKSTAAFAAATVPVPPSA